MKVPEESNIDLPDFEEFDHRTNEESYHQYFVECLHRHDTWNIDIITLLSNLLIMQQFLEAP
jgi:hypothetical protein